MVKRRIVLSSQEMNDLTAQIKLLESQLKRSNHRVAELENGVRKIEKHVAKKPKKKDADTLCAELIEMTAKVINPPVKVREERLAREAEEELANAD